MDGWRALAVAGVVLLAACAGSPTDRATPADGSTLADGVADANASSVTTGSAAGTDSTTESAPKTGTSSGNDSRTTATRTRSAPAGELTATVAAVVSPDTLVVRYANGSLDRVRLVGVDAPAVHRRPDPTKYAGVPDTRAGEGCLRGVARDAAGTLSARLVDAAVTLSVAESGPDRDSAGRLRATVTAGDTRVDRLVLLRGFARVAEGRFDGRAVALNHQAAARGAGDGVWRCSELDWQFGSNTTLSVTEVHANAADGAPDRRNLNDEFVVLNNTGDRSVNLTGWQLFDAEGANDYEFPAGFVLEPNGSVILHSGNGFDRAGHLFWGLNAPMWDNEGDVVYVRRPNGTVALRHGYGKRSGP